MNQLSFQTEVNWWSNFCLKEVIMFKFLFTRKNPTSLLQVLELRKLFLHEKPDIVHARSRVPAWLAFIALKLIIKSQRPKFITTVHGFIQLTHIQQL